MDKDLFKTVDTIIRNERFYAQVNLMREDVMKRFGIGRHRLNDLLNDFADGMTFPQLNVPKDKVEDMLYQASHPLM